MVCICCKKCIFYTTNRIYNVRLREFKSEIILKSSRKIRMAIYLNTVHINFIFLFFELYKLFYLFNEF